MRLALLTVLAAGCHVTGHRPSPDPGRHVRRMSAGVEGHQLAYWLDVPAGQAPGDGWPLVLFLHGSGERGDELDLLAVHGPPRLRDQVPELAGCVLVSPQCPHESCWRTAPLLALLDEVEGELAVDPDRVYLTGLSMGGYGTWNLLAAAPRRFAAAVPICGGGEIGNIWPTFETGFELDSLAPAAHVPIRVYHGEDDGVVPLDESTQLVRFLAQRGCDVQLTVYPGVEHDSWTRTYDDADMWAWLFEQRRGAGRP